MFLSIIIPMHNEEAYVSRCLNSVLRQIEGRDDVEILCVDGASTDRTREIVREYVQRDGRIHLIENPDKIVPRSMNLAIQQSRGDVIFRLDCHAEYATDYIESCLEVLERTGADVVGGYMKTLPGRDSPAGRAIAAATSSWFGVGGSIARIGGDERETDIVPFGCFLRDVFERFGLYDERLVRNQDIELFSRIRRSGGRIIVSPRIRLTYYNRSTFGGLWQQAFRNGLWNPYTIYLVGGGLRLRHFAPLAFVLSIVLLAVIGTAFWPAWVLLACEVMLYCVLGSVGAVRVGRKASVSALLTFAVFVQLHLAYGIGSLWGILTAPFKFGSIGIYH